jgi:hypothetical protein
MLLGNDKGYKHNKHAFVFVWWDTNQTLSCFCADDARGSNRLPAGHQDEPRVPADALHTASAQQAAAAAASQGNYNNGNILRAKSAETARKNSELYSFVCDTFSNGLNCSD